MGIFDRVKGALGHGGSADYIGDLADDSWGEVPMASPTAFLSSEPRRTVEEPLPRFEDDWGAMLRQAHVREEREEYLIRVPALEPPTPMPESTPDTDWDALLAQAKARAETRKPDLPAPVPAPLARPQPNFAMGTVPPPPSSRVTAKPSTAFLPAPRAPRHDDEWETVIARAKSQAATVAPAAPVDPWEDAIRRAKTKGAA